MLPFQIARRFLWRSKLQSTLIVLGIGVGIGTQVFVGSLIASLQASLIDTTVGSSPHVTLEPVEDGERIAYSDALATRLERDPGIVAIAPQQRVSVLARSGDASDPLVVRLVERDARDGIYGLDDRIVDGDVDPGAGEVVIGLDYAEEAGLEVGDETSLLVDSGEEVTATVSGIFDLGVAGVNLGTAFASSDLLDLPTDAFDLIELQVSDVFDSDAVATRLADIEGITTSDWQEQNRELLTGLQSQSVSSIMIQVFVVIAVGLGIASTLAIAAVQKTRQIGILKALGLSDRRCGTVFLWQAALLGLFGTALGLAVGWGLIAGFDAAASGSEALFPVDVDPVFAAVSAAIGMAIALLSALIPYRSTARLDPIAVIQSG
ncbi:MAG: FtsX-like permease family protein [Candidatus Limnocylindria bacterium]